MRIFARRNFLTGQRFEEKKFMINKWSFYTSLTLIIAFLSSGFKPFDLDSNRWFLTKNTEGKHYTYPSETKNEYRTIGVPFTAKYFIGFKETIAFKESQGQYKKVNSLGYMGKYQFGAETLKTIGIHDCDSFLNNPRLQEKAFVALLAKNKWLLQDEIDKYEGRLINGIKITESGILAAAHLGGAGSVKKYFRTNGKRYLRDAYGTSVRSYLENYSGYDTSFIVANNNARVN